MSGLPKSISQTKFQSYEVTTSSWRSKTIADGKILIAKKTKQSKEESVKKMERKIQTLLNEFNEDASISQIDRYTAKIMDAFKKFNSSQYGSTNKTSTSPESSASKAVRTHGTPSASQTYGIPTSTRTHSTSTATRTHVTSTATHCTYDFSGTSDTSDTSGSRVSSFKIPKIHKEKPAEKPAALKKRKDDTFVSPKELLDLFANDAKITGKRIAMELKSLMPSDGFVDRRPNSSKRKPQPITRFNENDFISPTRRRCLKRNTRRSSSIDTNSKRSRNERKSTHERQKPRYLSSTNQPGEFLDIGYEFCNLQVNGVFKKNDSFIFLAKTITIAPHVNPKQNASGMLVSTPSIIQNITRFHKLMTNILYVF